jgi:flagellar L-ring protein precursor FlgH
MKSDRPVTSAPPLRALGLAMVAALLAIAAGCAAQPSLKPSSEFAPVLPVPAPQRAATGSIYNTEAGEDWFGRQRQYKVGDVITVILEESTQAARSQSSVTARESKNDAITPGFAQAIRTTKGGGLFSDLKVDGANIESSGKGTADQRATLSGSIAATVVEVHSNGNLVLRGEKQLALTEGSETIQITGVIRSTDVAPNGTVQSRRMANAQIAYRGTGDLASAARVGWGSRLLYSLWPF